MLSSVNFFEIDKNYVTKGFKIMQIRVKTSLFCWTTENDAVRQK